MATGHPKGNNVSDNATGPLDPSLVEATAVTANLGVDPSRGLSGSEAARRLASDGPNELRQSPPEPLWHRILRQFQDPLVYLLLVAVAISLLAWFVEGAEGLPVDVLVIAALVIANAGIGFFQERRAESAVAALASMTAATATVLRDGQLTSLPATDLVRGDILILSEGDSVAADGRLVTAAGLRIQESSLTGESEAVDKTPGRLLAETALGDRVNMVYKGTAVVQGVGRAVVTSIGMDTEMGAIATLLDSTEAEPSPLQKEIANVSKALGLAVIGIAVVVMVALALINGVHTPSDLITVLLLGVSLAVAAVPEGLPAILSLVLAIGVQVMARHNAVLKNLHSAETLGSASVICSDKTGTLTRNEMTLRTVVTASGQVELSGTGYRPSGGVVGTPPDAALREARMALIGGSLANNAQLRELTQWEIQGDPTEAAFLVALRKLEGASERVEAYERRGEVPFTSTRKMMSVLGQESASGVHRLFSKGAPDILLTHCTEVLVGTEITALDDPGRNRVLAAVGRLSGEGYRTLGVAFKTLDADPPPLDDLDGSAEEDLVFVGVAGILDPPREEAAAAVAEAHRAGIRTVLITGDHPGTAVRIASDLGLVEADAPALTGADLDRLSEEEFRRAARATSLYARVAPEHKLRIVNALRADGQVVAMTGDGVNDAPALKAADIGVAMGIAGTEVTKEAATMILADDNYATIVAAVRQGRAIFDNIRKFLRYLLSSNLGEVTTVFFGVVLAGVIGLRDASGADAIAVPLLATQILWINLVTDSGPALAMGLDPEDGDVMARAPRRPDERIIDRHMWQQAAFLGIVMGAVTLVTIDLFLPGGLIEGDGSLSAARTAGFTTLVFAQLFNALNARSDQSSAFGQLFTNRWLWAAIAFGVGSQIAVVETPFLQAAFGTTHLEPAQWAITVAMASVVLWVQELVKLVRRGGLRRRTR